MADKTHRDQYDFVDGFTRHVRDVPAHSSCVGFIVLEQAALLSAELAAHEGGA